MLEDIDQSPGSSDFLTDAIYAYSYDESLISFKEQNVLPDIGLLNVGSFLGQRVDLGGGRLSQESQVLRDPNLTDQELFDLQITNNPNNFVVIDETVFTADAIGEVLFTFEAITLGQFGNGFFNNNQLFDELVTRFNVNIVDNQTPINASSPAVLSLFVLFIGLYLVRKQA